MIFETAVQVLAEEGAHFLTTTRVAEKAEVSIGPLYQNLPNKAAILSLLQRNEWRQTSAMLRTILEDSRKLPLETLPALVHVFITSECDEAAMRLALNDAGRALSVLSGIWTRLVAPARLASFLRVAPDSADTSRESRGVKRC